MATTTTTTTNQFLKTLTISITTPSLQKPTSLFIPKSFFFTKPTKQFTLSLQKSTIFTSPFIKCVESSTNPFIDDEEEVEASWDSPFFIGPEDSGLETEDGFFQPPEDAKLYVGNLPYDVDSDRLAIMFDGAGVVEAAEVIYSKEIDRSRGFGFVTMSTVEDADKAVEMFSNFEINGRSLVVNKAVQRGSRPERTERQPREFGPSFKVYVGNLPWDVDSDRLVQLFSEHGKVLNARVVSDQETGRSRGFGFITMASETEMSDAIAALDGQSLEGRAIRVNAAEERPPRRNY